MQEEPAQHCAVAGGLRIGVELPDERIGRAAQCPTPSTANVHLYSFRVKIRPAASVLAEGDVAFGILTARKDGQRDEIRRTTRGFLTSLTRWKSCRVSMRMCPALTCVRARAIHKVIHTRRRSARFYPNRAGIFLLTLPLKNGMV